MCVLDGRFCITATDAADAVLRVVAVNDCHIESLHVMQVTCHKHRERRLACASFWVENATYFVFSILFVSMSCYTLYCWIECHLERSLIRFCD